MTDAEKQIVIEAIADLEKLVPELISAEAAKLPEAYAPLAAAVIAAVMPSIIAKLDEAVKAKLA